MKRKDLVVGRTYAYTTSKHSPYRKVVVIDVDHRWVSPHHRFARPKPGEPLLVIDDRITPGSDVAVMLAADRYERETRGDWKPAVVLTRQLVGEWDQVMADKAASDKAEKAARIRKNEADKARRQVADALEAALAAAGIDTTVNSYSGSLDLRLTSGQAKALTALILDQKAEVVS